MADQREQKLAKLLVEYSVALQKGESCLINAVDIPTSIAATGAGDFGDEAVCRWRD